jgi:DeoR family glycerol-3-phosphate regulon repressor
MVADVHACPPLVLTLVAHVLTRHHAILDPARQHGKVSSVEDLALRFDVTQQTIRRDLNELCDRKLLARVHGGAMISSGAENVGYEARRGFAAEAKAAIARSVAALVPDHASVFIAIGITTGTVAQELLQHTGLLVVTNDLVVANTMRPYPNIEVVIAGGVVRRADAGVVGEAAVDFVRQYRVDYAIIAASAIDPDGTLLDYDFREVKVTQAVMESARNTILATDATNRACRARAPRQYPRPRGLRHRPLPERTGTPDRNPWRRHNKAQSARATFREGAT